MIVHPRRGHRHRPLRPLRIAIAIGVLSIALIVLAFIDPNWWQPVARDASGALETARALEQGIASEMTKVRGAGPQPWAVRLRDQDVNAWFGARLPQWLEFDQSLPWPSGVEGVQLHTTEQGMTLAAKWHGFVLATRWRITPGTDGAAALLRAEGTSIGLLPVPFATGIGAWFVPQLAQPLPLEVKLGDGRHVRVTGVEFAEGEAIVDCVTLPR